MGHFGKAYVNIFYEIEISLNSNITHHQNLVQIKFDLIKKSE